MGKVPETPVGTVANYDVSLRHEETDKDGRVRTLWHQHPFGNRQLRRSRQRHHPYFTKKPTPGRMWRIVLANAREHKHD